MATAEESLRTIDADGHVLEQLELDPAITEAFMDRLSGGQVTSAEDPAPEEVSQAELMYSRLGGSQPGTRLKDMDADGIDIAVLYPTSPGLGYVPDAEVFVQMSRAYNDWLHEYCSADSESARRGGPGTAPGSGAGRQGDGALRQRAGLQGGDDPPRSLHREQEAQRPDLRPVLGRRRPARLPGRACTPSPSPTCRTTWSPGWVSTRTPSAIPTRA